MTENQVAQTLNQARRDLGVEYKHATPQPLRDYIYDVNMGRYGDKLGPTYANLKEAGKSDSAIINSSSKPNSNIDKLLADSYEKHVFSIHMTMQTIKGEILLHRMDI